MNVCQSRKQKYVIRAILLLDLLAIRVFFYKRGKKVGRTFFYAICISA